ncbi:GAF domain-containing protein [Streptomyces sp. NPDC005496]|uniref:GAF domain-containing protein n=1 Tax=unclassified Streptomyces TaxID=2593676 RepID=UPI0033AFD2D3
MPGNTAESSTQNWNTALKYIAGRKAAEESLGFVAHISTTVRETQDVADVVPAVARTCVPFFATGVSLDAGPGRDQAVVQAPDELAATLEALRALAIETEQRQIVVSEHEGLVGKTDPRHLELLREGGCDSAVVLSLAYRGLSGGHLVLARAAKHRRGPFSPGDLALACEVADRVGAFNALLALSARAGQ